MGKMDEPEVIRLTEAQRREIVAKLSKPNAPSKRALGREYEVSEGAIHKIPEMKKNHLSMTKSSLSRHLLELT